MFKVRYLAFIMMLLTGLAACTKDNSDPNDPKKQLQSYIEKSFAVKDVSDRARLLEHLTGDAKTRLAAWSDDQFRAAFIENKREFAKLSFREVKNVSATEVSVTYEISYTDQSKGANAKVTTKKLAQMVKPGGAWLVKDVKNINELIEFKDEMSPP